MWIKRNKKGGSLPAFHGARFQQGFGLGSIFRGLFRWAVPHLQHGAKMLGKKALQTGVDVAQNMLAGENLKTAVTKQGRKFLGLPSQNSSQAGAGQNPTKKKAQPSKISSPPSKKRKTSPQQQKKPEDKFPFLSSK